MSEIADFINGLLIQSPELAVSFVKTGAETWSVKLNGNVCPIEKHIGEGGQACVLKCGNQGGDSFGLKLLRSNPTVVESGRFEREFVILKYFRHPSVVRVFDFGIFENSTRPWMTMEFIEGGSLRNWLEHHPVRTAEDVVFAVRTIIRIAVTLAALHDMNVIHRDIKPENILFWLDQAGSPQFKLVDFGLCRAEGIGTRTNEPMAFGPGTKPYMPIEQWNREPTIRTDQFALAVTLYEWLTGQYPFQFGMVPTDVRLDSGIRPDMANEHNRHVPPSVARVLNRMLAKDESRRFDSLRDAAVELGIATEHLSRPRENRPKHNPLPIAEIELTGVYKRQAIGLREGIAPLLVDHFVADKRSNADEGFELVRRIEVAQHFCKRLAPLFEVLHNTLDHEDATVTWIRSDSAAMARTTAATVVDRLNGFQCDLKSLSRLVWYLEIAKKLDLPQDQLKALLSTWKKGEPRGTLRSLKREDTDGLQITNGLNVNQFEELLRATPPNQSRNRRTRDLSSNEIQIGAVIGLSKSRLDHILDPIDAIISETEEILTSLAGLDETIMEFQVAVRREPPPTPGWWDWLFRWQSR